MPEAISRRPYAERGRDAYRTFRLLRQVGDGRFGFVDGFDDLDGTFIENTPMLGRGQFACGAVEEAYAQMTLKFLDAIAGDCRRSTLIAPGCRKVSKFDNANENTKIIKVRHGFRPKPYTVSSSSILKIFLKEMGALGCFTCAWALAHTRPHQRESCMYEYAIAWDWLNFAVRWLHVITGIAWIGSSFYFVALDLGLRQRPDLPVGAHGEEWQVHGGGFYHIQKYLVAPEQMPEHLTWFKWESYRDLALRLCHALDRLLCRR